MREAAASLPDAALYTEGPYPFLVWESGSTVQGVVITVPEVQYATMLRELDALEDYTPGGGEANLYERIAYQVQTAQGSLRAWVYLAGPRPAVRIASGGMRRVPDGNWM